MNFKPSFEEYAEYHRRSMEVGDVDPSYPMLRYVCDRFELNQEQRYWLAFLYATTYCGPTVYYIYNEFPDYENVDFGRLERWWKGNREKLYFQTDRRWIRSRNQWCDVVRSYSDVVGTNQEAHFKGFRGRDEFDTYAKAWNGMSRVYQFGRYAMFLYLEAVHVVTGFPMEPQSMDVSDAESSRNGLAYALDRKDLVTHGTGVKLTLDQMRMLQGGFDILVGELKRRDSRNTVWNAETTLCAFKKYKLGKRFIGYYIDRQRREIEAMERNVREGVDWSVLWDFRKQAFSREFRSEAR